MQKIEVLSILMLLIYNSCSNQVDEQSGVFLSDLSEKENPAIRIEMKEEITLETNDSCLISRVSDLAVTSKGDFIILDTSGEKLLMFDQAGNFVKIISHQGKGPGEFIEPNAVSVDRNDNIYLSDYPEKIIQFNSNGQFLRYLNFDGTATIMDFCIDANARIWFLVSYDDYLIHYVDQQGNVLERMIKPEKNYELHHKFVHDGDGLYADNDKMYAFSRFSNTFFRLTENTTPEPVLSFESWPDPPVNFRNRWNTSGPSIGGNIEITKWWQKIWQLENFAIYNRYFIFAIRQVEYEEKNVMVTTKLIIYDMNEKIVVKNIYINNSLNVFQTQVKSIEFMFRNHFFIPLQPEMDESGDLKNTKIQKYEIVFEE